MTKDEQIDLRIRLGTYIDVAEQVETEAEKRAANSQFPYEQRAQQWLARKLGSIAHEMQQNSDAVEDGDYLVY